MANERRVRFDFVAGGLSVGMTPGDTLMQSNGLQDMPALATDEFCPVSLFTVDALGRVTKKEIVHVTAHSAGAGSATVIRGRLGTSAQTWAIGDRWSHSDLANDNELIVTTATRPSQPFEGERIYDRTTGRYHWWNGSAWIQEQNLKMHASGSGVSGSPPAIDTGTVPFKIQAGTSVLTTNGGGGGYITFPVAFPNGVIGVWLTNGDASVHDNLILGLTGSQYSVNGFEMIATNAAGARVGSFLMRINWVAVGW